MYTCYVPVLKIMAFRQVNNYYNSYMWQIRLVSPFFSLNISSHESLKQFTKNNPTKYTLK